MVEGMTLSLRRFADEFGVSRDLIKARIEAAGVTPAGERNGHAIYRVRDVAPLLADRDYFDADGRQVPNRMPPAQRRAWYQSEHDRIDLEVKAGRLIPAHQHESEVARMAKLVVQFCDTLPDVMERDFALSTSEVARAQQTIDNHRDQLYREMVGSEGLQDPAALEAE